jgi:HK97 family phage prohead protease
MYPKTVEQRQTSPKVELREDKEGNGVFVGRAVVYNSWSDPIYGIFKERIIPGAFDDCLARGGDIIATVNHCLEHILGRTSSRTLTLEKKEDGIDVEVTKGNYTYALNLAEAIKRGDLRGMSFMFDVLEDKWDRVDDGVTRTVIRADIYEVAFVFHPAYPATDVSQRGIPLALPVDGGTRSKSLAAQVMQGAFKLAAAKRQLWLAQWK